MTATSLEAQRSSNAVYRIERRLVVPRIDTLERIAETLAVSPGWLAYGEGAEDAGCGDGTTADIGARLHAARLHSGLSRTTLGAAAKTSRQTIANIEAGGMIPKVDTAELLARALGISPSWLAFGEATGQPAMIKHDLVTKL